MILPTTPSVPTLINPRVLVLYGAPKVGKTTTLAQLPSCCTLEFDQTGTTNDDGTPGFGADGIGILHVNIATRKELSEFCNACREHRAKTGTWPYRYIAMDTVTAIESWCEELATEKYRQSELGKNFKGTSCLELPKGAGYLWLRLAFQEITRGGR